MLSRLAPQRVPRYPLEIQQSQIFSNRENQPQAIVIERRTALLSTLNFHKSWIVQCEVAEEIRQRYGLKASFDYVVAEKLLNFADAAARYPEFARELPRFVSLVRQMFAPQEIRIHLARIGSTRARAPNIRLS
jgi:hypothetical protein